MLRTCIIHREHPELPSSRRASGTRYALIALLLLAGCTGKGPIEVYGSPAATFSIAVGQQLRSTNRTDGPGEYLSPPTLTGSAIAFLDESLPSIQVPAGVTQLFRFSAEKAGHTIVTLRNTRGPGRFTRT